MKRLTGLIRSLRGPGGCPWDREQTPGSMAGYLLEETYELLEAIEADDVAGVCEELGDVLFHLVFIVACFEEKGHFDLDQVIRGVTEKMTRRHPHVFGGKALKSADAVRDQWQRIKAKEKNDTRESLLASVPRNLPALIRALRVSQRAAGAKFDWKDISGVLEKVEEEWKEFKAELDNLSDCLERDRAARLAMELGDLLFTLVNVARFARVDPERALHGATRKFERRFHFMEKQIVQSGRDIHSVPQAEKDALWEAAKKQTTGEK